MVALSASISYVPFVFYRTGSAASGLHDVPRPDCAVPLFDILGGKTEE